MDVPHKSIKGRSSHGWQHRVHTSANRLKMSCLSRAISDFVGNDDEEAVDSSFSSSFLLIMDGEDELSSSSGVGDRCLGAILVKQ